VIDIKGETFDGTYPFAPHYLDINGFQMHFVDEGDGEPVLLLHGDPTWGYLWRRFIPILAPHRRCIVPDQMGMGKSGTPESPYPYRLRNHIANLEALVLQLDLHELTLVLHDWGGPVGLGMATLHPHRIRRLVLMNTWAFAPWPGAPFPKLIELIRSARGEKFVLEKNGYLEPAFLGTTHHPEKLTEIIMDAYRAPFPTPASRRALLCWSRDIPVHETDPSYAEMKQIEERLPRFNRTPTLLVWGMRDPVLPESVLRMWQQIYPHAITHEIDDASHFLQEDAPDLIVSFTQEFLDANP
jgi:pimeloyl-ACP methyl ester carboxylesterase